MASVQKAFLKRQTDDQIRKLHQENRALTNELNAVKKCASCLCKEEKSSHASALGDLLNPGMRLALSTSTIPPIDPVQPQQSLNEISALRNANSSLQHCVDNLQQLLKEKAVEAMAMQQEHQDETRARDLQVDSLHKQLQNRIRNASQNAPVESAASDYRTTAFLKERDQLIRKIEQLEEQLDRCQIRSADNTARQSKSTDGSDQQRSSRYRYCESCNQLACEWNNFQKTDEAQRNAFALNLNALNGSSSGRNTDNDLNKQIDSLKRKLQQEQDTAQRRLLDYDNKEKLLRQQKDSACAEVERVSKRCEALEVELSKRRHAETLRRRLHADDVDAFTTNEPNVAKDRNKDKELQQALERVQFLESELTAERSKRPDEPSLATLRSDLQRMEQYKRNCERRLADQERALHQLETDIALQMDEKAEFKRRCTQLERLNDDAIHENTQHLRAIRELQSELSEAQEKENKTARAHLEQIENYHALLRQKEAERIEIIEQLTAEDNSSSIVDSTTLFPQQASLEQQRLLEVSEQLEKMTADNDKLTSEVTSLKDKVNSVENLLQMKQKELDQEKERSNLLSNELEQVKKTLHEKEGLVLDVNNELTMAEVNGMKLETELSKANEELILEREGSALLRSALEELEELLQQKTTELELLGDSVNRANFDAHRQKENVFDLETKLKLQGRDLHSTRSKLLDLKTKIRRLERDANQQTPTSTPSTRRTISPCPTPSRSS